MQRWVHWVYYVFRTVSASVLSHFIVVFVYFISQVIVQLVDFKGILRITVMLSSGN